MQYDLTKTQFPGYLVEITGSRCSVVHTRIGLIGISKANWRLIERDLG
jgi:hypothetical protein